MPYQQGVRQNSYVRITPLTEMLNFVPPVGILSYTQNKLFFQKYRIEFCVVFS